LSTHWQAIDSKNALSVVLLTPGTSHRELVERHVINPDHQPAARLGAKAAS
jgi:hypothetical protein